MDEEKKANFIWLGEARSQKRLSQDEFATELQLRGFSITRSAIANWEQGRNIPRIENIKLMQAIADVLGISLDDLLIRTGYTITPKQSEKAVRAAIMISHLPDNLQDMALEYLQILEKQFQK